MPGQDELEVNIQFKNKTKEGLQSKLEICVLLAEVTSF